MKGILLRLCAAQCTSWDLKLPSVSVMGGWHILGPLLRSMAWQVPTCKWPGGATIGLVRAQEPVLYARSVRRNILYGLEEEDGEPPGSVPSVDDVEQAARLANAHGFISDWPQGYETVGGMEVLVKLRC